MPLDLLPLRIEGQLYELDHCYMIVQVLVDCARAEAAGVQRSSKLLVGGASAEAAFVSVSGIAMDTACV